MPLNRQRSGMSETEVDWCAATSSPPQEIIHLKITILTTSNTTFIPGTTAERNCFSAWITNQNLARSLPCTASQV